MPWIRWIFFACSTALLLWLSGLVAFVIVIFSYTKAEPLAIDLEQAPPIQAVVVLTGSPERLSEAFHRIKQGQEKWLFISGVNQDVSKNFLIEHYNATGLCCIDIGRARNTRENAQEARQWIDQKKLNSFYLMTADYHLPRAILTFTQAMPTKIILPLSVVTLGPWWFADPRSLRFVVVEYHKFLILALFIQLGI